MLIFGAFFLARFPSELDGIETEKELLLRRLKVNGEELKHC